MMTTPAKKGKRVRCLGLREPEHYFWSKKPGVRKCPFCKKYEKTLSFAPIYLNPMRDPR